MTSKTITVKSPTEAQRERKRYERESREKICDMWDIVKLLNMDGTKRALWLKECFRK